MYTGAIVYSCYQRQTNVFSVWKTTQFKCRPIQKVLAEQLDLACEKIPASQQGLSRKPIPSSVLSEKILAAHVKPGPSGVRTKTVPAAQSGLSVVT